MFAAAALLLSRADDKQGFAAVQGWIKSLYSADATQIWPTFFKIEHRFLLMLLIFFEVPEISACFLERSREHV